MAQKIFSLYSRDNYSNQLKLFVEVANTHIACVTKRADAERIISFEFFHFQPKDISNIENLFKGVILNSSLITKEYQSVEVSINNEWSVIVPVEKFDENISEDYLKLVYGDNHLSTTHHDNINAGINAINVYRVSNDWTDVLKSNLSVFKIRHSYSNMLSKLLSGNNDYAEFIKVQFYHNHVIVAVLHNQVFQFIQSFLYQSAEDVLYYLLSITERLHLNSDTLIMEVSGMIDINSTLYYQLVKYFRNIKVETIDSALIEPEMNEYPSQYFTPFFNLAL